MSDFDDKLDDLETELADQGGADRAPASSAAPLSIADWFAANGRAPLPSTPAPQQSTPPVDKSDSEDNSDAAPAARQPATLGAPVAAPTPPPSPSSAPGTAPRPSVSDYIGARLAAQGKAMQDAQGEARENRAIANVTEGLGQMTAGIARSNTFNPKSYDYLHAAANQPVQDVQAAAKAKLQAVQEASAENQANRAGALDDPNSMQSIVARRLAAQSLAKYKEDPSILDGMSAADLKEFLEKPLDQMENRDAREQIQKLKSQELALKRRELDQSRTDKWNQKAAHDQDQALQNVTQLLESARGNPAAAQAERDIYASQKADSLAKLYGDPDKLSPQMVQLLQSEVSKIASGGVPSMHELDGLNVSTMPKALASAMQTLTNAPSPANAGAFVKQYQDYAHALTRDAQKVISDKYGRVIETNKDRLGPDNYGKLKTNYLTRFQQASLSPEDQEAINWAKSNPTDPRAKKILELHGM